MPTDLRNRSTQVKEARSKVIQDLTKFVGYRCEVSKLYGNTDLHEFWCTSKEVYSDKVALVLLTHPSNIIVVNHDLHINRKPSFETCLAAIRNRPIEVWKHFGFTDYYKSMIDFMNKIRGFYETGQIKVPVSYIPIAYVPKRS